MIIDMEGVGDSVVIRFDERVTLVLSRGDAAELGAKLCTVAMLGGDTLDDATPLLDGGEGGR